MTKITGGTFKRDYIDRVSFRPTLHHDTTIHWQDNRQLTEADDRELIRGSSKEQNVGRTTLTIIFIIIGMIFVGVVGAVIAWFLAMKGDGPETTTYFIVSGGMHLNEDFIDELYNSSAPEFKNLSFRFCYAIREALQKNISKYGERFKHCEVNEFRNGSIVVLFTVYYVYSPFAINKEGVEEDLNISMIAIDSKTSYLSDLIVITSTINVTVTVETFTVDPIVIPITSTPSATTVAIHITTTSKSIETTSEPLTGTTFTATDNSSIEDEVTEVTTISALESTTAEKDTTSVEDEGTENTTPSTLESTTAGINTTSVEDEATDVTTISALESTTAGIDTTSVEDEATDATTILALKSTTAGIDTTSIENEATKSTTISAFESTTDRMDTTSAEDEAIDVTTISALESTTAGIDTTKINNESTTDVQITENSESTISIVDSTILPETTAKLTTEIENTTISIRENVTSMYSTTEYSKSIMTEQTTEMEIISTSIEENMTSTTFEPTIAAEEEYSADVHVPDIVAVVETITHVQACEVIPKGNWLYVNISVDYQGTSIVKQKYDHNNDISKIISHDRFSINIYMKNNTVVANLTLNLTSPISRICTLYDQYIFSCSVMMNDTFHTTKSNGGRIHVTAPVAPVTIDSRMHYNEGDNMYFNCSTKVDPNYSEVKAHFIKNDKVIHKRDTTDFGNFNNSDCSFNLNWIDGSPYPLTAAENGIIVRCIVTNTLLNKTEFADMVLNVTIADVAFSTYKIESSIGKTVSASCVARNVNSLQEILIRKMGTSDNITIASISFPNTVRNVDGVTVSYTNNSLSIMIPQLDCWDEGYYDCIMVQMDNSEVVAPAQLYIKPKNPPKEVPVTLTMNIDINDYRYLVDKFHSCKADVGYPESEGYLSLTFTHPETNANYTYDKKTITESMRITLASPYKFSVNLASGLNIIILEDNEPEIVNCTREKIIKFLLDITREWNKAVVTCSVKRGNGKIRATIAEEEVYVIPKRLCDGVNESGTYLPHEKVDNCKSYIQCDRNVPIGILCSGKLCFNHATKVCDWCDQFVCDSEITTTQGSTESTTTTPIQSTTPALICPFESCTSDSVFERETATISCWMNTSATYEMINVKQNSDTLLTIYPNNTVSFNVNNSGNKFECSVGASLTFTIKNVSCSDISTYVFSLVSKDGRSCSESISLNLKVKPKTPVLEIDYTWEVGKISNHACSGDVGNPAGILSLEIRNGTTGDFATYVPASQSRYPNTIQNCSNHQRLRFSLDFAASNLTGYHIRCVANNGYTLESSETSPVSNVVNINPLEANPCHRPNGQYPYPGICRLYLNCAQNITYVQSCGNLCFKKTTDSSGYCG